MTLDLADNSYSMWSALFDAEFRKFAITDHINVTVDAQAMWHNAEWLQVDQGIFALVLQLRVPATQQIMKMMYQHKLSVHALWSAIRGLFLDNADQRAIYALQEYHTLFQGDLKQLSDLFLDVGYPITEPAHKVINALGGLNSTSVRPSPPSLLSSHCPAFSTSATIFSKMNNGIYNTAKVEAAQELMATSPPPLHRYLCRCRGRTALLHYRRLLPPTPPRKAVTTATKGASSPTGTGSPNNSVPHPPSWVTQTTLGRALCRPGQ